MFSQKRKKNSYILLELVLALSLLALFAGPILQAPFTYVRKQKRDIQSVHFSLKADFLLALIEEKLIQNEIPWKTIEQACENKVLIDTLPGESYETKIFLSKAYFNQKEPDHTYGYVKTSIVFVPYADKKSQQTFSSTFFIIKKPLQVAVFPNHS